MIRGADADEATGRLRPFNPFNPRRRGVPGVAWGRYYTRASAYAACAAASSIFRPILSAVRPTKPPITWQWLPEPSAGPKNRRSGTGDYPLPDLSREASRSRSAPTKSVQFGPDGASFPMFLDIRWPREEVLRLRSLVLRGRARPRIRTRAADPVMARVVRLPDELVWNVLAYWRCGVI